LCKIGYTKYDPGKKVKELEKRYGRPFQFEWMRCTPGPKIRCHKIEEWWKHVINQEKSPVEGEEFYQADPEWLRTKLNEASELSKYPISFSVCHA